MVVGNKFFIGLFFIFIFCNPTTLNPSATLREKSNDALDKTFDALYSAGQSVCEAIPKRIGLPDNDEKRKNHNAIKRFLKEKKRFSSVEHFLAFFKSRLNSDGEVRKGLRGEIFDFKLRQKLVNRSILKAVVFVPIALLLHGDLLIACRKLPGFPRCAEYIPEPSPWLVSILPYLVPFMVFLGLLTVLLGPFTPWRTILSHYCLAKPDDRLNEPSYLIQAIESDHLQGAEKAKICKFIIGEATSRNEIAALGIKGTLTINNQHEEEYRGLARKIEEELERAYKEGAFYDSKYLFRKVQLWFFRYIAPCLGGLTLKRATALQLAHEKVENKGETDLKDIVDLLRKDTDEEIEPVEDVFKDSFSGLGPPQKFSSGDLWLTVKEIFCMKVPFSFF